MTQERLAEVFDMTPAGMQKWLAGTRQPALEDIDRIAKALKVPAPYLAHGVAAADVCTDLPERSRAVVRQLISLERAGQLPAAAWPAIEHVLTLATSTSSEKPLGAPIAPEHEAQLRELAEDGERKNQARRPGRRVSNG